MATYTVGAPSGVVTVEADTITSTPGGSLQLFKTGATEPVGFFQYWNYYTVADAPPEE